MPTITTVPQVQTLHAQAVTLGQQLDAEPGNQELKQLISDVLTEEAAAVKTAAVALLPTAQQAYCAAFEALCAAGAELGALMALADAPDSLARALSGGRDPIPSLVAVLPLNRRGPSISASTLGCLTSDGVKPTEGPFVTIQGMRMWDTVEPLARKYLAGMRGFTAAINVVKGT